MNIFGYGELIISCANLISNLTNIINLNKLGKLILYLGGSICIYTPHFIKLSKILKRYFINYIVIQIPKAHNFLFLIFSPIFYLL